MNPQALAGLKVLELGQLIAGPFAGRIFADFGAEVIKIEPPLKGDPIRKWRMVENGTSLWWYIQSRNKKSVALDLKNPESQELIRELVKEIDILIENFRPGTLEKWGIGYDVLKEINPRLIMIRISGYGQDGPYRDQPGFGSIGEAIGGLRYVTGHPDHAPSRVGFSLGDSISSLYAVIGAMFAIYHRDVRQTGQGQFVDVALYESIFSLTESMLPEFDRYGLIRERSGSALPGITPSNTYDTKDHKYIVIGANHDSMFQRLMHLIGHSELAEDPKYSSNDDRTKYADFLDQQIAKWTQQHTLSDCLSQLSLAEIPASPIYSIADIVSDPQYLARNMIQEIPVDQLGSMKMPGIVPKLSVTPGQIAWAGPRLGEHTQEVLKEYVKVPSKKLEKWI